MSLSLNMMSSITVFQFASEDYLRKIVGITVIL